MEQGEPVEIHGIYAFQEKIGIITGIIVQKFGCLKG